MNCTKPVSIKSKRNILNRDASENGASLIEFAISFPVFVILLFTSIEFSRALYIRLSLQWAAADALRWGIIGNTLPENGSSESEEEIPQMSRVLSIKQVMKKAAKVAGITLENQEISICPVLQVPCVQDNAGNGLEFIMVEIKKNIDFIVLPSSYTVQASVVAKNEPF